MLLKHLIAPLTALMVAVPLAFAQQAQPADVPEGFIKQMSTEILEAVKADKDIQAGDVGKINALVDSKVMPNVNFQRMTASAVGRYWRQATPEQQKRLQEEFKKLLVRTYAGALTQVNSQTTVEVKPTRAKAAEGEAIVRTEVRGSGEPIQLDYRLEKADNGWKIYDVNVLGIWLVEQYRNSFAQEIGSKGIDGLIAALAEKNKAATRS
jgi:phospholipid transport system substrate-binding protein